MTIVFPWCMLTVISNETCDGEEYLLRSTAKGAAESGTAARAVGANGLRRVFPRHTLREKREPHPLPARRISCVCVKERALWAKLSGTAEYRLSQWTGAFFYSPDAPKKERKVHTMKKLISLLLALTFLLSLAPLACADGMIRIGILQFAEHGSLDNCREGFIQGLAEEGFIEGENVTFSLKNAQQDMAVAAQIASTLVADSDMICAIATPAAQAAFNYAQDKNLPVIYTAITDPVGAALAFSDGTNPGQVTGTSDLLAVEAQLQMIRALMPEAKKIGILYLTSETNNTLPLSMYSQLAPQYGFEIVAKGISAGADIPLALDALLPQVDCLSNLTDNTVVSYLTLVLEMAGEAGKPVFGSEIEQVKLGCVAAEGLEYLELGKQTGRMAARVLKGESAQDIPYELVTTPYLYVNKTALDAYGLKLPDELAAQAIDVTP